MKHSTQAVNLFPLHLQASMFFFSRPLPEQNTPLSFVLLCPYPLLFHLKHRNPWKEEASFWFASSGFGAEVRADQNQWMRSDWSYPAKVTCQGTTAECRAEDVKRDHTQETAARKGIETFRKNGKQIPSQVSEAA